MQSRSVLPPWPLPAVPSCLTFCIDVSHADTAALVREMLVARFAQIPNAAPTFVIDVDSTSGPLYVIVDDAVAKQDQSRLLPASSSAAANPPTSRLLMEILKQGDASSNLQVSLYGRRVHKAVQDQSSRSQHDSAELQAISQKYRSRAEKQPTKILAASVVLDDLLQWLENDGAIGHSVGSRQAKAARFLASATADSALPVNSPSLAILSALEHHDDSRQRAVLRPAQASTVIASSSTIALPPNWVPAPPPKVKRFMLNDARDRYLPLVKEYSTDPKSGTAAPMLDLNSPPFTCPFGTYTPEDYEIEKERYQRRRRKRQDERNLRDAAKKAAAEAAAQGRPPPLPTASIMAEHALNPGKRDETLEKLNNDREAVRRAAASRPGYCELCHLSYKDLQDHLSGDVHVANANDDRNFVAIDAVPQKHLELKKLQATQREADTQRLRCLLLKHPWKMAELPSLFPRVARMAHIMLEGRAELQTRCDDMKTRAHEARERGLVDHEAEWFLDNCDNLSSDDADCEWSDTEQDFPFRDHVEPLVPKFKCQTYDLECQMEPSVRETGRSTLASAYAASVALKDQLTSPHKSARSKLSSPLTHTQPLLQLTPSTESPAHTIADKAIVRERRSPAKQATAVRNAPPSRLKLFSTESLSTGESNIQVKPKSLPIVEFAVPELPKRANRFGTNLSSVDAERVLPEAIVSASSLQSSPEPAPPTVDAAAGQSNSPFAQFADSATSIAAADTTELMSVITPVARFGGVAPSSGHFSLAQLGSSAIAAPATRRSSRRSDASAIAESSVPETSVPETSVPETSVPETVSIFAEPPAAPELIDVMIWTDNDDRLTVSILANSILSDLKHAIASKYPEYPFDRHVLTLVTSRIDSKKRKRNSSEECDDDSQLVSSLDLTAPSKRILLSLTQPMVATSGDVDVNTLAECSKPLPVQAPSVAPSETVVPNPVDLDLNIEVKKRKFLHVTLSNACTIHELKQAIAVKYPEYPVERQVLAMKLDRSKTPLADDLQSLFSLDFTVPANHICLSLNESMTPPRTSKHAPELKTPARAELAEATLSALIGSSAAMRDQPLAEVPVEPMPVSVEIIHGTVMQVTVLGNTIDDLKMTIADLAPEYPIDRQVLTLFTKQTKSRPKKRSKIEEVEMLLEGSMELSSLERTANSRIVLTMNPPVAAAPIKASIAAEPVSMTNASTLPVEFDLEAPMPEFVSGVRMKTYIPAPIAAVITAPVVSASSKQVTPAAVSQSPAVPSPLVVAPSVTKPAQPTPTTTASSRAASQSKSMSSIFGHALTDTTISADSSTLPASPPLKRSRVSSGLVSASADEQGSIVVQPTGYSRRPSRPTVLETTPSAIVTVNDSSTTAQRLSSATKSAEKRVATSQLSPEIDVERLLDNDNSFTDASAKKKRRLNSNTRPSPGISTETKSSKSAQSKHGSATRAEAETKSSIFDQSPEASKSATKTTGRSKKTDQVDAAKATLKFSPQQPEKATEIKGKSDRQPNEDLAAPSTAAGASGSRRSKRPASNLPEPGPVSEPIGAASSSARHRRRQLVRMNQLEDDDVDQLIQVSIPAPTTPSSPTVIELDDDESVNVESLMPAVSQPVSKPWMSMTSVVSAVKSWIPMFTSPTKSD